MAINAGNVYSQLILDMSKYEQGLKKAEQQMNTFTGKMTKIGNGMNKAGEKLSKYVTVPIVGLFAAATKSSIDFESAFAGVRKTVDATEPQFKKLEKGIRDMSKRMPQSASEIAKVAESAGQLGIKTENILGFTETMIMLGDATNLSSDQAATALARLANITGMPQTEFSRLGSSVVALGNNLATTESEIVEMGLRLAGTGTQVGLTEDQILALAGAMSSVGINAEAGGSSMSRVMQKINTQVLSSGGKLQNFAKVAGMSADEFSKAWKEKPTKAILAFIKGLDNVNKSGGDVTGVLKSLGITSIQEVDTLNRLSGASGVLSEALSISSNAWEENTALTKEAEQRYKTTESQLKIAKNTLVDAGRIIGDIVVPHIVALSKKLKELAEWFSNLSPKTQETIINIAAFAAAIGPALKIGSKFAGAIKLISTGLGTAAKVFGLTSGAATLTAEAVSPLATGIGGVGLAAKASALLMNPWTWAIAGAGVAMYELNKHMSEEAIPQIDLFGNKVSESTKKAVGGFMELNEQATLQLNQMAWSGQTVTSKMADSLVTTFNEMGDQILTSMRQKQQTQLTDIQNFFNSSNALSNAQEAQTLTKLQEYNGKQQQIVIDGEARIKEILNTAKSEKRSLKESERQEINSIQQQMANTAVEVMSQSEVEQEAILERLRSNASTITARQAAQVVQNSAKQKEKTIQNANEQYVKTKANIEYLRDDAKAISSDQAKALINDAEKQKNSTVKKANQMHNKVVSEAKKQSGEHVDEVNWETGEVKSKWQVMFDRVTGKNNALGRNSNKTWNGVRSDIRGATGEVDKWNNKKAKNKTVTFTQIIKTVKLVKDRFLKGNLFGIGGNARGTNYWRGGLTWVNNCPVVEKLAA